MSNRINTNSSKDMDIINYEYNTNSSNDMNIINYEHNITNTKKGKNILPSGTNRRLYFGSKFLGPETLISFLSETSVNKKIGQMSSTYRLSKIENVQDILREYSLSIFKYILSKDSNIISQKDIIVFNLCLDYNDNLIFEKTNSGKTPLIFACEQLNLAMVLKILDKIKNLSKENIDSYIYQMDNDGNTAPMILFSYFLKYPRKKNKKNKDLRNEILNLFKIDYSSNYISPNNSFPNNRQNEEEITGNSNSNNNVNENPITKRRRINHMNGNLNKMKEVVRTLNNLPL